MGMDIVELVMAIEDEFQIAIPNKVAAKMVLVGDFHAYVIEALRRSGITPDSAQVWERLKRVIINQCAIREDRIVPEADIIYDFGLD